jgi:hypothetical protein
MQGLTLVMFVVVTTIGFLSTGDHWGRWRLLPGAAGYLAELLSVVALVYVIVAGAQSNFRYVRATYWITFATLVLLIVCGAVVNAVGTGPIFAGVRTYLRAMPWFFVPAVYAFSERQIKVQLLVLLGIALLQLPLAVQQRMTSQALEKITGDWTIGTLQLSSTLSVFLICTVCVAFALYMRGFLRRGTMLLCLTLLVPTMINETKATLVLLPIGIVAVFLASASPGRRLRAVLQAFSVLLIFMTIAIPTYDYLMKDRPYSVPLKEFVTDPERLERYVWKKQEIGTTKEVGRVDAALVALTAVSSDPARFFFGYGIGNVSESGLGHGFSGAHNRLYGPFIEWSFSLVVLELGMGGFALILVLMWLVYRDARSVSRHHDGIIGAVAAGWVGVTVLMVISILYMPLITQTSLSYLFWYFAGLIAAGRMRRAVDATGQSTR